MEVEKMEALKERLRRELEELRGLKETVSFNPRSILKEFGEAILDIANSYPDPFAVMQDNDHCKAGHPIKYSPTMEEWEDFDTLLEELRLRDTEGVGIALITLPNGFDKVGLAEGIHKVAWNGRRFSINKREANTKYLSVDVLTEDASYYNGEPMFRLEANIKSSQTFRTAAKTDTVVRRFENMDLDEPWLTPIYATDKDVALYTHRRAYNLLPQSAIFPLTGNLLDHTRKATLGVHTPWMYMSEEFGTPFAMHVEDLDLVSLNVVHWGAPKVWTTIAPHHHGKLENLLQKELGITKKCPNWVRHLNIYVPKAVLETNGIHYCQFQQSVGQVVISFPLTYHQGFNAGPNVAEAINYAPKDWTLEGKGQCSNRICGYVSPDISAFQPLSDGESQRPARFTDPEEVEAEIQPSQSKKKSRGNLPKERVDKVSQRSVLRSPSIARQLTGTTATQTSIILRTRQPTATHDEAPSRIAAESLEDKHISRWKMWETAQNQLTEQPKLQPTALYNELKSVSIGLRAKKRQLTADESQTITTLITAFGSTAAFIQLREIFLKLRSNEGVLIPAATQSKIASMAAEIIALDTIDTSNAWNAICARYHLARFCQGFDEEVEAVLAASPTPIKERAVFIAVYEKIMHQAYPHLPPSKDNGDDFAHSEYSKRYRALRKTSYYGKHWKGLVQEFGWGILVLLPTGGEYGITNTTVNTMTWEVFSIFQDRLEQQKGEWLKRVSRAFAGFIEGAVARGTVNIPRLALEAIDLVEIVRYSDQSEELALLASQVP